MTDWQKVGATMAVIGITFAASLKMYLAHSAAEQAKLIAYYASLDSKKAPAAPSTPPAPVPAPVVIQKPQEEEARREESQRLAMASFAREWKIQREKDIEAENIARNLQNERELRIEAQILRIADEQRIKAWRAIAQAEEDQRKAKEAARRRIVRPQPAPSLDSLMPSRFRVDQQEVDDMVADQRLRRIQEMLEKEELDRMTDRLRR